MQINAKKKKEMQFNFYYTISIKYKLIIIYIFCCNFSALPIPSAHPAINNENSSVTNLNYQRDGGLSPTSNQLAQWFSPELLAQASAGKLPLLNMNQALSLEEFERSIQHSSTAVHN